MIVLHNKFGFFEVVSEDSLFYTVKPNKTTVSPFGGNLKLFKDECVIRKEYNYKRKSEV